MKRIIGFLAVAMIIASCAREGSVKLIRPSKFKTEVAGKPVALYTLKGGDITMQVTNFGARVVTLWTPDREGKYQDIVLGYKRIEDYVNNPGERFLGAVVGPYANRIAGGTYTIGEETYNFPQNRVTDHRLTGDNKNFNIAAVMNGDLDNIIDALTTASQAERLQQSEAE